MNEQKVTISTSARATPVVDQTSLDHRNQTITQIWLPLILCIILVIVLSILTVVTTANPGQYGDSLRWANLSLIGMIIFTGLGGLVLLIVMLLCIYGLGKLLRITPIYTRIAQSNIFIAAMKIIEWVDIPVQPVFVVKSWWSGLQTLCSHFRHNCQEDTAHGIK